MAQLRPVGDRVIVRSERIPVRGGLMDMTGCEKEKLRTGVVVHIGRHVQSDIKVGDTVIFGQYVGREVVL